jgi:hypothetical protein
VDAQTAALAAKSAGLLRRARQERERLNTLRRLIHEDNSHRSMRSSMSSTGSSDKNSMMIPSDSTLMMTQKTIDSSTPPFNSRYSHQHPMSSSPFNHSLSPSSLPDALQVTNGSWIGEAISAEKKKQLEPRPGGGRGGNRRRSEKKKLNEEEEEEEVGRRDHRRAAVEELDQADDSLFGATMALERCKSAADSNKALPTNGVVDKKSSIATQFKPSAFEQAWINNTPSSSINGGSNVQSITPTSENLEAEMDNEKHRSSNRSSKTMGEDDDDEASQHSLDETDFYSVGGESHDADDDDDDVVVVDGDGGESPKMENMYSTYRKGEQAEEVTEEDEKKRIACSPPRLSPNMHPGVRIRRIITRFF